LLITGGSTTQMRRNWVAVPVKNIKALK